MSKLRFELLGLVQEATDGLYVPPSSLLLDKTATSIALTEQTTFVLLALHPFLHYRGDKEVVRIVQAEVELSFVALQTDEVIRRHADSDHLMEHLPLQDRIVTHSTRHQCS